ncbi:MAG TPA: efflux RND transporter periplasmic adaptor subunit [Bryobacterales bacterium]|nr:efflux RND transporter periplasmic adaptor subunit [Bryobacterales bacterium]
MMQREKRRGRAWAAVAIAALLGAFTGCSRQGEVSASSSPSEPTVKIETAPDASVVEVGHPEEFPLVKVEARSARNEMLVNGVVAPDVSRTVPVNALAGGRVIEIRARLGDDVTKGQVLLRIHSADLAAAIADHQKAQADEALALKSLERAQLLVSHGAMAQKDLQQAEDTEQKAKVDVQTAAERIRILGGGVESPSSIIDVKAPASGTIIEQNTTAGAGVKSLDNSPNLFTIADLSRVWVLCDVYENNLSQVHMGDFAEVRLNAYPDRPLRGRVSNISKLLDPATRTAKVRLELDNRAGLLRPGMFATVTFISQGSHKRAVVPATAILRLHDKDWVFRPVGGARFRRAEVQGGPVTSDGMQEILAGLAPGDAVVANALQFSSTVEQK